MKKILTFVMGAVALVGGTAFVFQGQSVEAAKETAAKPAYATLGKAPEFKLKALDGKEVRLSDFKGKVRIVDFWATWCPPCREEIPDFISLQKQYKAKGLEVIGVSVDRGGPEVVQKFNKEYGVNYTSLMANDEVQAAFGGIRAIPTTFLIDRDGNIVKKYQGLVSKEVFEKDIKELL